MNEKINYGKVLEEKLNQLSGCDEKPKLLLHACCAPCSSYVLEYLCPYFDITLFFYNPNISSEQEYEKRAAELVRLTKEMPCAKGVKTVIAPYQPSEFHRISVGREDLPEGGARCLDCYRLRLAETARLAKEQGFDYFCTTLSISPHKNATALNEIGASLENETGVPYLYSDFKKKGGYKRSCELSAQYGLYRQVFCGCIYSQKEAENRERLKGEQS